MCFEADLVPRTFSHNSLILAKNHENHRIYHFVSNLTVDDTILKFSRFGRKNQINHQDTTPIFLYL